MRETVHGGERVGYAQNCGELHTVAEIERKNAKNYAKLCKTAGIYLKREKKLELQKNAKNYAKIRKITENCAKL